MPTPQELMGMSNEKYRQYRKERKIKENQYFKAKAERVKKIKRVAGNIKRVTGGIYKAAKAIPSIRYSESGRARLISNATKGRIPQNPLNAPSIYIKKPKVNGKYKI